MEEKISAIALKSTDYRENDKLVWLYSAEYGKVCIIAKGVKKAGAKLRFAAEPFCFGEYFLAQKADRFVLAGCSEIESFYDIRSDLGKYYSGSVMLEAMSLPEEKDANPAMFLLLLKSLQSLLSDQNPKIILIKFLLDYLGLSGYRAEMDSCNQCGSENFAKLYIDGALGAFVCPACRTPESRVLIPAALSTLRMTQKMPPDKLRVIKIKDEYINEALRALGDYTAGKLSKLKSLSHLLAL